MVNLPRSGRYAVAIAATAACVGLRLSLNPVWGENLPYITLFPAIMLSGWVGGLGAGLLATALSGVAAAYLWLGTPSTWAVLNAGEWLGLLAFTAIGIMMSALNELWRRGAAALASSQQSLDNERRRAESQRELQDRAARELAAIVESSDDAIVSKNLESTIRSWNRGAERMFGYSADEVIGQSIRIIIPKERWSEEDEVLRQIRRGEKVDHFETVRERKDGSRLFVSLTISPIRAADGTIVGASKIARDITERKLIEQERARVLEREQAARSDLERASRLKDDFLASLSHELRTPLNAMMGYSQLLSSGSLPPERALRAAQAIQRNAQAQARLVESMIDLSRVLAGKLELHYEELTLEAVIATAVEALGPEPAARGISFRVEGASGTRLVGDAIRLQQVFWNLFANAIKFTPGSGDVTVSVSSDADVVRVRVADRGQGISPEFLPHVFDRFQQGPNRAGGVSVGLGLGLALVREMVEAHGGTVTAESAGEGRGSVFTITLPRQPSEEAGAARPPVLRPEHVHRDFG